MATNSKSVQVRRRLVVLLLFGACDSRQSHSGRDTMLSVEPHFEQYAVADTFRGPSAPVDLTSEPGARRFRTVLTQGAAGGVNFAGHFTIVTWGCGTQCQSYAVIDASTGRVFSDTT